jgi:phosphatidate cytidylyltransferase
MTSARWQDLRPRVLSGLLIAFVGIAALALGGLWLSALAVAAAGAMSWELARMSVPGRAGQAIAVGAFSAFILALVLWQHDPYWMLFLVAPPLLMLLRARQDRILLALAAMVIVVACYAIVAFRAGFGLPWVLWLVLVVAAVDVLGYFGGRIMGGPKFWPRISPKKTWSGTIAGWAGAAAVGAGATVFADAPAWIIPLSVLTGFAGQMGDIAESAIKRRAGLKDASQLIPGHGGVMDRFDGLSGAALFLLVWAQVLPLPPVGA